MTYDILATGSSGNAVVINGEILVDCGVPYKKLEQSGYIKVLKLVLLTHEHGDHFNPATVGRLHRERPALRWGCCEWMVKAREKDGKWEQGPLLKAGVDKRVVKLFDTDVWDISNPDVFIMPQEIPHDVKNCCWCFSFRNGEETLFYATDTSTLDGIEAKGYDLYLIEANHTRAEIEARIAEKQARGEFAYEVRAVRNHLSREQAEEWLARNAGPNSRYVFLHQHKEAQHGLDLSGEPDPRRR